MSLWLCLRFPQLPLESLLSDASKGLVGEEMRPLVVIEKQRVIAANDAALAAGIRSGHSTATVRALLDDNELLLLERDRGAERHTLERLRQWAYSVTPTLEFWQDNALQLEIGSCLRLYGDLSHLCQRLQQALIRRGFTAAQGVAANRPAAWLLSYRDDALACTPETPLAQRLASLPIDLIANDTQTRFNKAVASLHKAGIDDFNALLKLPTSAVGKRCGKAFADWLSRVTASSDDAHQDFQPPPSFHDALWFGFEVRNSAELEPAMEQLLATFCSFLQITQLDAGGIEWQMLRMRGDPQCFVVRSSEAHSNTAQWLELSRLHLEKITIGEDIEGLALEVRDLREAQGPAEDLFNQSRCAEPLHSLMDRLRSRLGLQAVSQLGLRDAHLPEHSQRPILNPSHTDDAPSSLDHQAQRPFWLLNEPQPVHKDGNTLNWNGPLELIYGPERIEDNWWQQPVSRDYYIARGADQQPIWLFQDRRSQRWYVHGIFS